MIKLNETGTVDLGSNYRAARTADDKWVVSRKGFTIGTACDLVQAEMLMDEHAAAMYVRRLAEAGGIPEDCR